MSFRKSDHGLWLHNMLSKKARKHLDSIMVTLFLRHKYDFKTYLKEIADLWMGPLYDESHPISQFSFSEYTKVHVEELLSKMTDFEMHPVYNRDFFQGVSCSIGMVPEGSRTRFMFRKRDSLVEFLKSDEHRLKFSFSDCRNDQMNITYRLHCMGLPYKGDLDLFLAGAISAAMVVRVTDGDVMLAISRKCEPEFRKMGIIYRYFSKKIVISPFYLMLYSGMVPVQIFCSMMKEISPYRPEELKQAAMDAVFHWIVINGTKPYTKDMFPFLLSRSGYNTMLNLSTGDIKKMISEKRFDFVDKRISKKCERWYNISMSCDNQHE